MRKLIFFISLNLIFVNKLFALIEIDITRGNLNPLPIAVSPLSIDEESRKNFQNILKKKNIGSEISLIGRAWIASWLTVIFFDVVPIKKREENLLSLNVENSNRSTNISLNFNF